MKSEDIPQDHQADLSKSYGLDEDLPTFDLSPIIDKKYFVNKNVTFTIVDAKLNRWGKPTLICESLDPNVNGTLNITKAIWNTLLVKYGTKTKNWIGQNITLTGKIFHQGDMSGVTLELV